ncbi:hypothetical protein HBB16_20305 [Pseudonocardia sp. MCCB 268]|nr:hypothetical protein [Pseudonocardia cytotoxica]
MLTLPVDLLDAGAVADGIAPPVDTHRCLRRRARRQVFDVALPPTSTGDHGTGWSTHQAQGAFLVSKGRHPADRR